MKLEDLLDMDSTEVADWLIENSHKFVLHPKPTDLDSLEDLLDMDSEEVATWLIENSHKFDLQSKSTEMNLK
ncbi:hypothetical protein [Photobacterium damselae]|uniref:hypothetical protein n=1 Tax=Photobacterium damselae TaxID=38293 RepID=UPI0040676C51